MFSIISVRILYFVIVIMLYCYVSRRNYLGEVIGKCYQLNCSLAEGFICIITGCSLEDKGSLNSFYFIVFNSLKVLHIENII